MDARRVLRGGNGPQGPAVGIDLVLRATDRVSDALDDAARWRRLGEALGVQVGADPRGTRLAETADLEQLLARLLAQLLTPCYRGRDLLVGLSPALKDRGVDLGVPAAIDVPTAELPTGDRRSSTRKTAAVS